MNDPTHSLPTQLNNSQLSNTQVDNTQATVEPSLTEVLGAYSEAGFDGDAFAHEGGMILCGSCQSMLAPEHIDIHSIRRLEGESDPSDNVGVVALICPVCNAQATMVLKYGPEATPDEVTIWQQTNDRRSSMILPPDMAPQESSETSGGAAYSTPSAKPELPPPTEFE
jgi:hypothetical protein